MGSEPPLSSWVISGGAAELGVGGSIKPKVVFTSHRPRPRVKIAARATAVDV